MTSSFSSGLHHGTARIGYYITYHPRKQQWGGQANLAISKISFIRSGQRRLGNLWLVERAELSLLFRIAIDGTVLLTELVELGLDDLHDLGVLRVLVGNVHM